jgi:hypothetical protein
MITGDQNKTCPMCAMEVPGPALICHFCGYSFADGTTAEQRREAVEAVGRQHAATLAKGSRSAILIRTLVPLLFLLFVFFMVGLILISALGNVNQTKPTDAPSVSPIVMPGHSAGRSILVTPTK